MDEMQWWPGKRDYDPKITKETWIKLLDDRSIFSESNLHIFACFYDYGGIATCTELANKYGGTANTYLNSAVSLAKRIVNAGNCGKIDLGDEHSRFWPVLFVGHQAEKENEGVYVWKIRDELMDALKEYGIEKWLDVTSEESFRKLIVQYKKLLYENKKVALDDEKYKWELITNCKNVPLQKFVELAVKENVSNTQYVYKLKDIVQQEPENFNKILDNLFDEKNLLNERLKTYYDEMKKLVSNLHPESKNFGNDERMASVFLTCKFPDKYTFYKDSYYQKFCKYLNIKSKEAGEKYEHYLDLINQLRKFVENDAELVNEIELELAGLEKSSLLLAQNIVYTLLEEDNLNMDGVNKIDDYVNLLKSNHNIILHGAPGTGKTYLAKQIAKAMGANEENIGFVQFHPSYDYTDFVEGLRPKNGDDGQIGFKRKDGMFKAFCKRAIKSSENAELKVDNFDEAWKNLVNYLDENDNMDISLLSGKGTFPIELNEYGTGLATRTYTDETRGDWISGKSKFFSKDQLYNIYKGLPGVPMGGHDNYRKAIVKVMKDNFGLKDYIAPQLSTVNPQLSTPYVFIIDEINRGEISKIFGELFFSIDPGYRVKIDKISELKKSDMVQTQYQNLVTENDYFDEGFFVPENVYIIGTMNDIDRSVESMDFAMRRRFVFKEITAAESAENMNLGDEAKRRMSALNDAISKIEGLGSSYHIGAAYFLKNEISISTEEEFTELWDLRLESLLTEYLRGTGNEDKLKDLKAAYQKGESNSGSAE